MARFSKKTLNKCNAIAATMNPIRYMSLDGPKLVEIIKLLLPESDGQPAAVCAQLLAIGRICAWDLPRISAEGEASFLAWLVMEVAKTAAPAPGPVVPTVPMETASATSGPTLPGRRRR